MSYPMDTNTATTSTRQTAIYGLAVVGFITLIALGVSLAVYSARYIPTLSSTVGRLGAAAVSLSQVFNLGTEPVLSVVPTASTTIFFDSATTIPTTTPTLKKPVSSIPTTAGEQTSGTYPISGTTETPSLSGLPDLVVNITAVGYFTSTSTDSFIASSTVPSGNRPAVTFTIKNIGTNATGGWRFSASIPTQAAYIYQSQPQQSLNPGDSIEYTLGFDQANSGTDKMISITANFDRAIAESNIDNNSAATKITILGS